MRKAVFSALILALAVLVLFPNLPGRTLASTTKPVVFAYGIMISADGSWVGIEPPQVEVSQLIASGATYIRVAGAPTCNVDTGTPNSTTSQYLQELRNAGINLGVAIFLEGGCTASTYIQKGEYLLKSGWYDWIFLDGALLNADLQTIVNGLLQEGWTHITENDARLGSSGQVVNPATGVWGHFSRFCVLSNQTACAAAWPPTWPPTILSHDIYFINYVYTHFPNSIAVEEVEAPPETAVLASYPIQTQESLLASWAQQQTTYGYTMLYPYYTGTNGEYNGTYDCDASGTCQYQTTLISQYNSLPTTTTTQSVKTTTATSTTSLTSTTKTLDSTYTAKSLFISTTVPTVTQTTSTTTTTTGPIGGTSTTVYTTLITQSTKSTQTTLSTGTTVLQTGVTTVSISYTTTLSTSVTFTAKTGTSSVTEIQTDTISHILIGIIQQLHQFVNEFLTLLGISNVFTPVSRHVNQIIITLKPLTVTQTIPANGALEPPNTSIKLSVMVASGGSPVQSATVKFYVNGVAVCSSTSNLSGTATCSFTTGSTGNTYSWYATAKKPGYAQGQSVTSTFHT